MHRDDANRAREFSKPGGLALNLLGRELLQRGFRVAIVSHLPGTPHQVYSGENFRYVSVESRVRARDRALSFWRRERFYMAREVRKLNPQLVHAHWTYEYALAGLTTRIPLLITAHDAPLAIFKIFRDPYRFIRLLVAIRVSFVSSSRGVPIAAVSPALAADWLVEMRWRKFMPILTNFTELTSDGSTIHKAKVPVMVEIANASDLKRVKLLLCSFVLVREKVLNAQLHLIGEGLGHNGPMHLWAQKEGLSSGVTFLGLSSRDQIVRVLKEAWVHVHLSKTESFGLTVIEAMALGCPVVALKSAGAVPWLLSGGCGIVVDSDVPKEIARSLVALLADNVKRDELSEKSMKKVAREFSPKAAVDSTLEQYRKIISQ
jgi:glycosyltransferase involved in cell wall biosynthesis